MQHVAAFGYPTPPASPAFEQQLFQTPRVPVTPEDRLGHFLTDSLRLTGILGTGAYGVVYAAVDVKTKVQYAVKCLSKINADGSLLDRRQVAFQSREIKLHHTASAHPNVVSLLKLIDNADCTFVIMEYCPEGDLFYNITERGQYVGRDELAKDIFLQILDAVEHCHQLGIYHRDLKPENILVTDHGMTVKLADFGLATASDRSEDYGCGSTFYMSPECLDHSSGRPYYYCAPNDVWSLGVILVNLTCGRNPWKQATVEDSTYRAYVKNPAFLKTILPVTDEMNNILGRIFTQNPEHRVTLPQLRDMILACPGFTDSPSHAVPTPPVASPEPISEYVDSEESVIDDELDYEFSPSSGSSGCMSEADASDRFDDGPLSPSSSCSSLDELDDNHVLEDLPEVNAHPRLQQTRHSAPTIHEDLGVVGYSQEFTPKYRAPAPVTPLPGSCAPAQSRFALPSVWEALRFRQGTPQLHHPAPFHHQVPLFASLQRCC